MRIIRGMGVENVIAMSFASHNLSYSKTCDSHILFLVNSSPTFSVRPHKICPDEYLLRKKTKARLINCFFSTTFVRSLWMSIWASVIIGKECKVKSNVHKCEQSILKWSKSKSRHIFSRIPNKTSAAPSSPPFSTQPPSTQFSSDSRRRSRTW